MLTTSPVEASPQHVLQGPAPLRRLWIETSAMSSATTAQCFVIIGGIVPTASNSSIMADNTQQQPNGQ